MNYNITGGSETKSFKRGVITVIVLLLYFTIMVSILYDSKLVYKLLLILGIILFHGITIYLIYVANKRFLRLVIYDSKNEILELYSIFKTVKSKHRISEIRDIKLINSQGFGNFTNGFRNKNLVIKIHNTNQPQICQIRNVENFKKAELLVNLIVTTHNKS